MILENEVKQRFFATSDFSKQGIAKVCQWALKTFSHRCDDSANLYICVKVADPDGVSVMIFKMLLPKSLATNM